MKIIFTPGWDHLAIDGKKQPSHANPRKDEKPADGRRDVDADFGKKVYHGQREDGTMWEKVVSWFGYRLHLIVDSKYELPVAFKVTKASLAEGPQAHALLDKTDLTRFGGHLYTWSNWRGDVHQCRERTHRILRSLDWKRYAW